MASERRRMDRVRARIPQSSRVAQKNPSHQSYAAQVATERIAVVGIE
jgi:hypothetical protein